MSFDQVLCGVAARKCSSDVTQIKELRMPFTKNDESIKKIDEQRKSSVIHGDFSDESYI